MTLLKASLLAGFGLALSLAGTAKAEVDLRFSSEVICRDYEGKALCPKLSHLLSRLEVTPTEDLALHIAYDPAQSRKATWYDSLSLYQVNLPPQRSWLADYGFEYALDDRVSVAIEDGSGTTLLPNASYLAFSRNLQDIGWRQTLARLTYDHRDVFKADLMYGLGEGERLEHDDAAGFLAARARWTLHKMIALELGASADANSLPKDSIWWLESKDDAHKDFKSKRFAASLIVTDKIPFMRGFEAALGYQHNRIEADGQKQFASLAPTRLALDPTEALAQSEGGTGNTSRDALLASASYRILAEYILALHYGTFRAKFDDDALTACAHLDDSGSCLGSTTKHDEFKLEEWTYGLGKIDVDGWSFLLESHEERYDRLYQNFHFLRDHGPRQKNMHLVQARIRWNW